MIRALLCLLLVAVATPASAADRSPYYADFDVAVGMLPGLAGPWGKLPFSGDIKVGGGVWIDQRVGGFANVGVAWTSSVETSSIGDFTTPVTERFRLVPIRGGVHYNLWPRPDWLQLDVLAGLSLTTGSHEILHDGRPIGREFVFSPGGFGGLEVLMVKYKRMGFSAKALYVVQPAPLGKDKGFLTQGLTGLGGPELSLGWVVFLGGPS